MTLDLAKLRAETLALIDGTTPGPWSVFINDASDKWTGWPLSVNADNIADKTIVRPGGHWPYEWDAKTSQHEAGQNARLIAAAPALAADTLRLLGEIERLKRALVEAAIPLEAIILATQDDNAGRRLYGELLWNGIVAGVDAIRTALPEGGPDDR